MEKMKHLKDLLTHEIQDLYSAEEQIIQAMPMMIEKSKNEQLKKTLQEHLRITEEQKNRLDQVRTLLKGSEAELAGGMEDSEGSNGSNGEQKRGFLSGLFGGGSQVCRGMQGLIEEGQKVMNEDMNEEVLDAAIIASAQKIEHYEICGYGTARAYARELNLGEVAELLEETLREEYQADDLLTDLAVGGVNEEAEGRRRSRARGGKSSDGGKSGGSGRSGGRGGNRSKAAKKAAPKKAAPKKAAKKAAPARKAAPKKAAKKAGGSKGASKSAGRGKTKSKGASTRNVKSPGGRAGTSHRGPRGR
jgi:ferritin-like metal-binding protein YciE